MRVAFVHDWLVVSGGAEKVTRELLKMYDADVFSLFDFLSDTDRAIILHGKHAKTTFLQHLPFMRSLYRWYLPLFPAAVERIDLRGYDLIISASYAVAKGVRKHPGQKHVCYIHTPVRYAWVHEDSYLRDHGMTGVKGWLVRKQLDRLRAWDVANSAHVDRFIANSRNVADRAKRFYGREAEVVLPPVDPDIFTLYEGERAHYLAAARLVPYKRMDRIIEAFALLPDHRLTVVGDGPDRRRLERMATTNVTFTGHVPQERLVELMQRSRALICAADEDLGLTPLEALACGTPVIALGKSGYLETVIDGVSGIHFPESTADRIADAVRRFEALGPFAAPAHLRAHAAPFFSACFREQVKAIIDDTLGHA